MAIYKREDFDLLWNVIPQTDADKTANQFRMTASVWLVGDNPTRAPRFTDDVTITYDVGEVVTFDAAMKLAEALFANDLDDINSSRTTTDLTTIRNALAAA